MVMVGLGRVLPISLGPELQMQLDRVYATSSFCRECLIAVK